ncbi:MAG: hypothetical protein ACH0QD_07530 [Tepidibacillus sp.]
MSNKVKLGLGIGALILAGSIVTTAMAGETSEPGSQEDPLVTKSYVDQQINLLKQSGLPSGQPTDGEETVKVAPIIVLNLKAGDLLVGNAGTEMILRAGTATAYSKDANGIPDVTGATDLKNGTKIPLNHQLIYPRNDGRGVKIVSGTAVVMVRGEYEVVSENVK